MAIRNALIIERDDLLCDHLLIARRVYGSKIKYRKHAFISLDSFGIKFKFTMEIN